MDHSDPGITDEQRRDLELLHSIRKAWNDIWKPEEEPRNFNKDEVSKFLQAADTHRKALPAKEKRIQEQGERIKNLEADLVQEQGAHHELTQRFDAFKLRAAELVSRFHKDGITELQGGIERVIRIGDDSQPRLLNALDGMQQLKDQFNTILDGIYRELVANLAPDVALLYAKTPAAPTDDSQKSMRELFLDQVADRISRESFIHGAASPEPAVLKPAPDDPAPVQQASEDPVVQHPSLEDATEPPASPSSIPPEDQDNVLINPKHLIPKKSKREKRQNKRQARRLRQKTIGFESIPPPDREDEATSIIDSLELERKFKESRGEVGMRVSRTGDTLRPDYAAMASENLPSSEALAAPPVPIASLPEDPGDHSDRSSENSE